jgi:hypothetical protein
MASYPQQSAHEPRAPEATWGDHFGLRVWVVCFLLMALHCLLNVLGGLWGH